MIIAPSTIVAPNITAATSQTAFGIGRSASSVTVLDCVVLISGKALATMIKIGIKTTATETRLTVTANPNDAS